MGFNSGFKGLNELADDRMALEFVVAAPKFPVLPLCCHLYTFTLLLLFKSLRQT